MSQVNKYFFLNLSQNIYICFFLFTFHNFSTKFLRFAYLKIEANKLSIETFIRLVSTYSSVSKHLRRVPTPVADKETESFGVLYLSKSYKLVSSKVYFLVVFYLKSTYGGFCVLFIIIKIHQLFIFIDMYMFFITELNKYTNILRFFPWRFQYINWKKNRDLCFFQNELKSHYKLCNHRYIFPSHITQCIHSTQEQQKTNFDLSWVI